MFLFLVCTLNIKELRSLETGEFISTENSILQI